MDESESPLELTGEAALYWSALTHDPSDLREFTETDYSLLAKLCRLMAMEDELAEQLEREGLLITTPSGAVRTHPAVNTHATILRGVVQLCASLRLTRSARLPRTARALSIDPARADYRKHTPGRQK